MEILRWKQQDVLVTKAPKRSPLILRSVVLVFIVLCGLYIFSMCIKQSKIFKESNPLNISLIDRHGRACRHVHIEELDIPYLHFPNPDTFSRSGSGWFETLLNSHENLSSNGEILGASNRRSNASVILETLDKVYNLDWFSSASKNECSAAVGFKWMLNQGLMKYHEEIVHYLNRRGVSLIFLFRRNHLRRMVSLLANVYDKKAKLLNGMHKSHVHSSLEAKVLSKYKPSLNTTMLLSNLRSTERTVERAMEYYKNTRHILVYYEDVVANQTRLEDVQDFLKLPRRNLTSLQVKIHSGPLSKQIDNWDDVKKTLEGTSHEQYIKSD